MFEVTTLIVREGTTLDEALNCAALHVLYTNECVNMRHGKHVFFFELGDFLDDDELGLSDAYDQVQADMWAGSNVQVR